VKDTSVVDDSLRRPAKRFGVAVESDNARPAFREDTRYGSADSGPGARNDNDPAVEIH
jgi:hypothetical protein